MMMLAPAMGVLGASPLARRPGAQPRLAVAALGSRKAIGGQLLRRRPVLAPRAALQQHAVCSAAPLEVRLAPFTA